MTSQESSPSNFGLPEEILHVLPTDPYEQLDVARKITSIALLTRVSDLESESDALRSHITEKEAIISELRSRADTLGASLNLAAEKLAAADVEKENLRKENELLSDTILKLSRHVAKLEVFKRTLVQSLHDEEQILASHFVKTNNSEGISQIIARPTPNEEDGALPPSRSSADEEAEEDYTEVTKPGGGLSSSILSMSPTSSTPQLSPPLSPITISSSVSPSITPKLVVSRRHPLSFTTSGSMFYDNSSVYSDSSSHRDSFSAFETGSQSGRTRANGREFLRQVRNRLSYEQFAAFLANVKDLTSHRQTKEEALQKASEIFGSDNMDLYETFQALLTRNNVQ